MLQRIQTLFILLAFLLMGSLYFLPLAVVRTENEVFTVMFDGFYKSYSETVFIQTVPLIILLSVIVAISFVTIFLYKKRVIQMRLNFINLILMLGFAGLSYFYITSFANGKFDDSIVTDIVHYRIFAAFPFVSAVFTYLGIRAIGKDEALVRSIDRIR